MNPSARRRTIAWSGLLVLLILHFDFWRDRSGPAFVLGFPSELTYRLVWVVFAFFYLRWFTAAFWRQDDSGSAS